jgi:hypothetical protein
LLHWGESQELLEDIADQTVAQDLDGYLGMVYVYHGNAYIPQIMELKKKFS